jgi:hypothetical protein
MKDILIITVLCFVPLTHDPLFVFAGYKINERSCSKIFQADTFNEIHPLQIHSLNKRALITQNS